MARMGRSVILLLTISAMESKVIFLHTFPPCQGHAQCHPLVYMVSVIVTVYVYTTGLHVMRK